MAQNESIESLCNKTLDLNNKFISQRIVCYWMSSILLSFGLYVAIALLIFEYKEQAKNKRGFLSRCRGQFSTDRDNVAEWMRQLCWIGSILIVVRICLELPEIRHGEQMSSVCLIVRRAKGALHSAIITCVYLALWLRQRQIYSQPFMHGCTNKVTRFFSVAMIVIMVVTNVITVTLYIATRTYTSSCRGCVVGWSVIPTKLPGVFLFVCTISFQFILFGLLVYPLYKHKRTNDKSNATGNSGSKSQKKNISLIQRVSVAAAATIITDVLCGAISVFVFPKSYGAVRHVLYDFDMMVALFCVVFSFNDWRVRLLPCCAKPQDVVGALKRGNHHATTETENTTVTAVS